MLVGYFIDFLSTGISFRLFSCDQIGVMGLGEEDHRGEVLCAAHHVKGVTTNRSIP